MKNRSLLTIIITTYCCWAQTTITMELVHKIEHRLHEDVQIVEDFLAPNLAQHLHGQQPAIANNPYKDTIAHVTYNPGISDGERLSVAKRQIITEAGLEEFLKRPLAGKRIPKVGLIFSGGGARAAMYSAASCCGAKKIGLLECVTYTGGCSGSTWFLGTWLASELPITKCTEYLQDCLAKPFLETTHEEKVLIADAIAVEKIYHQPQTLVNLYAGLLGTQYLAFAGDKRHMVYLSDQAKKVEIGDYPYPIFTATDATREDDSDQKWFNITPHTIWDNETKMHVPTWACGRTFEQGQSTNNAPEKPLDWWTATCGSAFTADVHTIIKHAIENKTIKETIEKELKPIEDIRPLPFWGEIPNYLHKMESKNNATLPTQEHLKLDDAGLNMNLSYEPFSGICPERTVDIAILVDSSAGKHVGNQLEKIAAYTRKHNLPFPVIKDDQLGKKTLSIYKDENNQDVPVIMYMPRISDKELWEKHKNDPDFARYNLSGFDLDYETNHGFCKTQEFQYTKEHSTLVKHQAQFNMLVNEEAIRKEINAWIDKHNPTK